MLNSLPTHIARRAAIAPRRGVLGAALLLALGLSLQPLLSQQSAAREATRGAVHQDDAPAPPPGPPVGERVVALVQAFDAVSQAAGVASDDAGWQRADAAFNLALDALDVHQAPLVAQLGEPAAAVFAEVEARLAPLAGALDGNDVVGVRVIVAQMRDLLDNLAPVAGGGDVAPQQGAVLQDWQATRERAGLLLESGRWRDARNEAIALLDDIAGRGALVDRLSPTAALAVQDAELFALRMRAAAIDQAAADGAAAGRAFDRALQILLVESGAAPPPTPVPAATGPTRFRGYQVVGGPGEQIDVPIVAEAVPQIGLGAIDLTVAWSPAALQLLDVEWSLDAGEHQRDDGVGRVRLSLPQAPIGPAGDVIFASLRFEVLSGDFEARDLLPAGELATLDNAIADAVRFTRTADRPKAAALLGQAYYTFVEGRGEPGSLFEELARHGLSDAIATPLKAALAMASREEAANDEVVIAVAQLRRRYVDALDAYGTALAAGGGMPIRLDVRSARDTTGAELSLLPAVAGEVLLPAVPTLEVVELEPTPERAVEDEIGAAGDEVDGTDGIGEASGEGGADGEGSAGDEPETSGGPTSAGSTTGQNDAPAPFPRGLIAALFIAAIVGVLATAAAMRGGEDAPAG